MEAGKRRKFRSPYRQQGHGFAPMVTNSWGVCGPDMLRFLWAIADNAARCHYGLPNLRSQPIGSQEDDSEDINPFKAMRGRLYHYYRLRILCVIYEGVTERMFGRTYALSANTQYNQWMRSCREAWQPVLHDLPPPSS